MSEYLKYNLPSYLNKDKNKYSFFWLIPFCLFLILLFYAYKKEAYDVLEVKGQIFCQEECTINFFYPTTDFIYEFIKINHKTYEIETVSFSDPVLDSNNNALQNISLKVKKFQGNQNEFVTMQIYKNKERLLKKIAKSIIER